MPGFVIMRGATCLGYPEARAVVAGTRSPRKTVTQIALASARGTHVWANTPQSGTALAPVQLTNPCNTSTSNNTLCVIDVWGKSPVQAHRMRPTPSSRRRNPELTYHKFRTDKPGQSGRRTMRKL